MKRVGLVLLVSLRMVFAQDGLVQVGIHDNFGLLVGVANGLPGISYDMEAMREIIGHPAYNISQQSLRDQEGTPENVADYLTELASEASGRGSLFFYYTGHGNVGVINTYRRDMSIQQIREAMIKGINLMGPIRRITLFFDSCKSGSLVDPVRENEEFADRVLKIFQGTRVKFWQELFILASTRPNENCLAGSQGSQFTLAVKRAFGEVSDSRGTVSEFINKVQTYTKGSHPTYRLVPQSIAHEQLLSNN